jgi:hypothetical protein
VYRSQAVTNDVPKREEVRIETAAPRTLEERLKRIIIPRITIQDMSLVHVIGYLEAACEMYETPGPGKENKIKFVLDLSKEDPAARRSFMADSIDAWETTKRVARICNATYVLRDDHTVVIAPDPPASAVSHLNK